MDFQIQQILQDGTKKDIGGKDGRNNGLIFNYSLQMDLLNSDKIFKALSEIAILFPPYPLALNFQQLLRKPFSHKQRIALQFML
jgi:hypothetical protein